MESTKCSSDVVDTTNNIGRNFPLDQIVPVVKREPIDVDETFKKEYILNSAEEVASTDLLAQVKIKNETAHEVTSELVGFLPSNLSCDQLQLKGGAKNELFQGSSADEYCCSNSFQSHIYESPKVEPGDVEETQHTRCDVEFRPQSETSHNSVPSMLRKVTVSLVDVFSDEARKRGEVHLNNQSCSCVFCRNVYKDQSNSHLLAMNFKNPAEYNISNSELKDVNKPGDRSTIKKKILFKCAICPVQCKNTSSWKAHWVVHWGNYECFLCKVRCTSEQKFEDHMMDAHSIEKAYRCSICSKSFRQTNCLVQHFKVHIDDRPFRCDLCSKAFKFYQHLTMHKESIHLKVKPYSCGLCRAQFSMKGTLSDHMRSVHSNKRPFECKVCCKSFKLRSHLVKHSRMHSSEKPFKCELCPATFRYPQSAKEHLRVHSHEKPYHCSICPKSFKYSSHLSVHERRHTKKRTFVCDLCKATFKTRETISSHIRVVHLGEKPAKCNLCPLKTRNPSALKKHMKEHEVHEETRSFKCPLCSAKFAKSRSLKIHLTALHSERSFYCEICQVKFSTQRSLTVHCNVHKEERKFKCDLCCTEFSKSVDLTKHMDGHDAGEKFFCAHCPSAFKHKKKIITHLKIHSA